MTYYGREEIRQAIAAHAAGREVGVRYGEGFGKRPDLIRMPGEVKDLAAQGATSFHCSEERWSNPALLRTGMSRKQLDGLRAGWDLVLDIDARLWRIAQLTTYLLVEALRSYGVSAISVKFSGNKGFHIGVPFEAFPPRWEDKETSSLFPEAPRAIAQLLLERIAKDYIKVQGEHVVFGVGLKRRFRIPFSKLEEVSEKESLTRRVCASCGKEVKDEKEVVFVCPRCQRQESSQDRFSKCERCGVIMERKEQRIRCCPNPSPVVLFDPLSVIEVDTVLLASRHLFRMPYSLHEKSGLVSLPLHADRVLDFEKKQATPEKVKGTARFLDPGKVKAGEAGRLLEEAMRLSEQQQERREDREFEAPSEAVPESRFPPAIKTILGGLEDGRKRALFILVNFLRCVGWTKEMVETRLREWNEVNPEPLREQEIVSRIRYVYQRERILPPNYATDYYTGIGITPTKEELRLKNPVRFSLRGKGR